MTLSSCTVSKQLGSVTTDSNVATGSISEVPKDTALAATDAEAIKSTVIKSETFSEGSNLLSWANPETGNSGTITAIERTIGAEGHPCRKFETTVSSFNGVSIYNGETCEAKKDIWTISWLLPKDFGI